MFVVRVRTHVMAPIERCFLLSTHVGLGARTIGMKPGEGSASGLLRHADRVVWRGWKCGLPQWHESRVTEYASPTFFRDCMDNGRFRMFEHDHEFVEIAGQVLLEDTVRFAMPLGFFGKLVARYVIIPRLLDLIQQRFALLKQIAETDEWREYLDCAEATP